MREPVNSKYRNDPQVIDGVRFDSKREAARYVELKALAKAGLISDLELQPRFPLTVNGVKCGAYVADFRYRDGEGREVVEDVKGVRTPFYILKSKLVRALHGVEVVEVR